MVPKVRSGKVTCEGCGGSFHPIYMTQHQLECAPYREWSRSLPHLCRRGCGMGFKAPRARANHERSCEGTAAPARSTCRLCRGWYSGALGEHLAACPGPSDPPEVSEDVGEVPDDGCGCGYSGASRSAASAHRAQCAWWWVYAKRLPEKCEGCGRGFKDVYGKRVHTQACQPWHSWRAARDVEEMRFPCPSCGNRMRGSQLGLHVRSCMGPWTAEDWHLWRVKGQNRRTALRDESLMEGGDYVECRLCGDRFRSIGSHMLCVHGITVQEYVLRHGGPVRSTRTSQKTRKVFMERYGVDHPRKVPEINARAEQARVRTMMERYGVPSPMQAGLVPISQTWPERAVAAMGIPGLHYTGDHRYWVSVKTRDGRTRARNPDFVVYDPARLARVGAGEPPNEVRTGRVVEVLGDYWHGPDIQGMGRVAYVAAREAEYRSVGITCLVVWESEVKSDPEGVRARLAGFLNGFLAPNLEAEFPQEAG